jgi:hypothetical protein
MGNPVGPFCELLDQSAGAPSQFHPHTHVKASADFEEDLQRLVALLVRFAQLPRNRRLTKRTIRDSLGFDNRWSARAIVGDLRARTKRRSGTGSQIDQL